MTTEQQPQGTALALADRVKSELSMQREHLARLLGGSIPPERFISVAYEATRNPNIARAIPETVIKAVWDAANLGLEPSGILGEGYIVSRWSRDLQGYEAQFAPGYRGLAQLARRSGEIVAIDWGLAYDEDEFEWVEGTSPSISHKPARHRGERSLPTHAYAWAKDRHGQVTIVVLDRAEVEHVRSKSPAKNSGPWVTDWGQMALKTAVRRLSKKLPLSPEMQRAVALDDAVELAPVEPEPEQAATSSDRLRQALEPKQQALGAAPACPHPAPARKANERGVYCDDCGEQLAERAPEQQQAAVESDKKEDKKPAEEKPKRQRKPKQEQPAEEPQQADLFSQGMAEERAHPTPTLSEKRQANAQVWQGTVSAPFRLAEAGENKVRFNIGLPATPDGRPGGKAQVVIDYGLVPGGLDAGVDVIVSGTLEMVAWTKADEEGNEVAMPPYRRIHASSLDAPALEAV